MTSTRGRGTVPIVVICIGQGALQVMPPDAIMVHARVLTQQLGLLALSRWPHL
jgi:hypothetical protein